MNDPRATPVDTASVATGADHTQHQQTHPLPLTSASTVESFSMLVDLNLADDAFFLDLDVHDSVLELQALDVRLDASTASLYSNGSDTQLLAPPLDTADDASTTTTTSSAVKPYATPFTTSLEEMFADSTEPFATSATAPVAKPVVVAVAPSSKLVRKQRDRTSSRSATATAAASSSLLTVSGTTVCVEDDRRKRHNANERRRTNALKSRLVTMRDELAALERERDALQQASTSRPTASAAAMSDNALVPQSQQPFLEIVATIDRLRCEKAQLLTQLQTWDMQNSTYQTIVTEFRVGDSSSNALVATAANNSKKRLASGDGSAAALPASVMESDVLLDNGASSAPDASSTTTNTTDSDTVDPLTADDAPIFQKILFATPMALADALECVRSSYNEIMAFRSESEFDSLGGEVLGWRDKRVLDADSLQFMLAQHFDAVLAHELVYKTWHMLTTFALYRRIQPRTTELQVLQRVNNDCVIARLSVGSGAQQHHTILLIARGRIDGGYLITYRSIPLSAAKQQYAETEGTYVSIFNWFMFLDKAAADDFGEAGSCEVIFGGKVKNRSAEYLRYLMMEVVAGVVRWQTAVGHSKFRLTN